MTGGDARTSHARRARPRPGTPRPEAESRPGLRVRALLLSILLAGLAGCSTPPEVPPPTLLSPTGPGSPTGEANGTHPEAGAFREPVESLQRLEEGLAVAVDVALAGCDRADVGPLFQRALDENQHVQGVWEIANACSRVAWPRAENLTAEAMANGTEEVTYGRLRQEALDALERERAALTALLVEGRSGDVAELELHAALARHHAWARAAALEAAPMTFEGYRERGRPLDLENAYGNLLVARLEAEAVTRLVERYPWSGAACVPADKDEALQRIDSKIAALRELAEAEAREADDDSLSTVHGRVLKEIIPDAEYYRRNGWWTALFAVEMQADWYAAFLAWDGDALPSREEAAAILASYRAANRTILGEHILLGITAQIQDSFPWERTPERGRLAATIPDIGWPFERLACPRAG